MIRRSVAIAVLTMSAVSCQKPPPPPPPAPVGATMEQVESVRTRYTQVSADARVGQVVALHTSEPLAAVGGVPVADFKEGDAVTFLDSGENVIAFGVVIRPVDDTLHVRFTTAPLGRPPIVDDIVVRAGRP